MSGAGSASSTAITRSQVEPCAAWAVAAYAWSTWRSCRSSRASASARPSAVRRRTRLDPIASTVAVSPLSRPRRLSLWVQRMRSPARTSIGALSQSLIRWRMGPPGSMCRGRPSGWRSRTRAPSVPVTVHASPSSTRYCAQVLHEHHFVARLVGGEALFLRAGAVQVDEAIECEHRSVQHALLGEALAHHGADVAALRVGRRHQERARALVRGQRQVLAPGALGERFGRDLLEALAEVGERARGPARERIAHRLAQHRVALAHELLHVRGGHAGVLQEPEGRPGAHRLELAVVAAEHRARHPDGARQAGERAKLAGRDHRRLVDNQDSVATERARQRAGLGRRMAALEVGKAGEAPVDGARLDPRLVAEHPRGGRRRREAEHRHVARQAHDFAHQGGLARARGALHRDGAVRREQDEACGRLLAGGQARRAQARLDRRLARERIAGAARCAHPGDERALAGELARGHKRAPAAVGARLEQLALSAAALERRAECVEPVAPRMEHERGGQHVALAQHGGALLQVRYRLAHRLARARHGRVRLEPREPALAPGAPERLGQRRVRFDLCTPLLAQRRRAQPGLLPSRGERGGLRRARAVAPPASHDVAHNLAATRGVAREQPA